MASKSLLSEVSVSLGPAEPEDKPSSSSQSLLSTTLRALRLHLFQWHRKSETKKIAIYHSRKAAVLHTLLHLLPLAGVLTLIILNLRIAPIAYTLGGSVNIPLVQFIAKVLEVLIQASIAAIVLGFVRREALGSLPVPFGALVAPYKMTEFSYLWSLEFWGLITSRSTHSRIRYLCIVIPFSLLLATAVGPASAVLMIPRQLEIPYWHSIQLLQSADMVYPEYAVLVDEHLYFESEFNKSIPPLGVSNDEPIQDLFGTRMLQTSSSYGAQGMLRTVPTLLSSYVVAFIGVDSQVVNLMGRQPYVGIDCYRNNNCSKSSTKRLRFGSYGNLSYLDDTISCSIFTNGSSADFDDQTFAVTNFRYTSDQRYLQTFVAREVPPSVKNHSALVAFTDYSPKSGMMVTACAIDAYWADTDSIYTSATLSNIDNNKYGSEHWPLLADTTLIKFSPSWLVRVLQLDEALSNNAGFDPEGSLPGSTALALSNIPPVIDLRSDDSYGERQTQANLYFHRSSSPSWRPKIQDYITAEQYSSIKAYLDPLQKKYQYDSIYVNRNLTDWSDLASVATLESRSFTRGPGYNASSTAVRLSIAVLMIYMLFTITFLIYTFFTGHVATSWDSVSELVSLALNSERPEGVQNTSVGIDTIETFRRPVNIRVNDEMSAELIFGSRNPDESGEEQRRLRLRGYRNVTPNVGY